MKSEAAVQVEVMLELSRKGCRVWRNNSGAVTTEDGRHIRFGLGNVSAKQNKSVKSSDLIGCVPVVIGPEHLGKTLGVFTAIEVKSGAFKRNTNDSHQNAQERFMQIVRDLGGIAGFISDASQLEELLYVACSRVEHSLYIIH